MTADHPMRKIRPLIDTDRIRPLCEPLYAHVGRPSIPPEQLLLALVGGYLLGVTSERAWVRELAGNLVLRWFVGWDLDAEPWDHSTFSPNRTRRFTESGLLEQWVDETVALAITQKLVLPHTTLEGTLVQANASHKSCVPMEVFLKSEEYKRRIRSLEAGPEPDQDPGHPTVTFRGERRSHQTHVSTTDPDAKLANTGRGPRGAGGLYGERADEEATSVLAGHQWGDVSGTRIRDGRRARLDRCFHQKHRQRIQIVGADKGYVAKPFLRALFRRRIRPHIAAKTTGREAVHQRVRRLGRTVGDRLSQRARKKIDELWGEANCWHGFRRFRRRELLQIREEAYLMGWLLNLKRLATLLRAPA